MRFYRKRTIKAKFIPFSSDFNTSSIRSIISLAILFLSIILLWTFYVVLAVGVLMLCPIDHRWKCTRLHLMFSWCSGQTLIVILCCTCSVFSWALILNLQFACLWLQVMFYVYSGTIDNKSFIAGHACSEIFPSRQVGYYTEHMSHPL